MKASINWNGSLLTVDFSQGRSLAIDIDPDGTHPSFFSSSGVRARPLEVGSFVGDMASGGSCNAEIIEFSTHSHGTHTECVGHISLAHQSVTEMIDQQPTLMRLITVKPDELGPNRLIPASVLAGLEEFDGKALAIRTRPNEPSKKWRNYDDSPEFPVLSPDAMQLLSGSGLLHLLVDTPSVDRADNDKLENHATWWGLNENVAPGVSDAKKRSITEMIFVADEVPDGDYWLDLQMPPLVSDAVPSRPLIYPVTRQ